MPLAYYSEAATAQIWSEHWGEHSVEEPLLSAPPSDVSCSSSAHIDQFLR